VGRHSTGEREEFIVLLEGTGEVRVAGVPPLAVAAGTAAYVPPRRSHDVVNTGERPLRYVYVVAPAAVAEAR
jgi:mannose-6-phosphate isomerase-like protein (cupin superfamily)